MGGGGSWRQRTRMALQDRAELCCMLPSCLSPARVRERCGQPEPWLPLPLRSPHTRALNHTPSSRCRCSWSWSAGGQR
jgi:hypothetical protein